MIQFDVAIIGGGIAGLVASIELAQAGKSVVLFERSSQLGGRAISVRKNGAIFDLRSHAIIKGGALHEILQDLGIRMDGGSPGANVSFRVGIITNWGKGAVFIGIHHGSKKKGRFQTTYYGRVMRSIVQREERRSDGDRISS